MTEEQYASIGRQIVHALVRDIEKDGVKDLTVSLRDHRRVVVIYQGEQEVGRVVNNRTIGRGD